MEGKEYKLIGGENHGRIMQLRRYVPVLRMSLRPKHTKVVSFSMLQDAVPNNQTCRFETYTMRGYLKNRDYSISCYLVHDALSDEEGLRMLTEPQGPPKYKPWLYR